MQFFLPFGYPKILREDIVERYENIIHRTFDDSYIITKNNMPYHVYPYAAEFAQEWDELFT